MSIKLSPEQQVVFDQCDAFLRAPLRDDQRHWFCFQGLAGCGKSLLMAQLAQKWPRAMLACYTGKAASVLARKSGLTVNTLHSCIYKFCGLHEETKEPKFWPKVEGGDWSGNIAFVDECGTIDVRLGNDLLATGCKVIACGDPGQLQPVKGKRFFDKADAKLTEVHRQAWDSPIIRQAHRVRQGLMYEADGADFQVKRVIEHNDILAADIVLCYRNTTRLAVNKLVRAHRGIDGAAKRGEPVMCLRNDHKKGVLNGAVYTLLEDQIPLSGRVVIENERGDVVRMRKSWIEGVEPDWVADDAVGFAFGYCSTCHKSQGSSWKRIIVVDEYDRPTERAEFLYTAITRAEQSVIMQRNW